jgi:hypothetical protein
MNSEPRFIRKYCGNRGDELPAYADEDTLREVGQASSKSDALVLRAAPLVRDGLHRCGDEPLTKTGFNSSVPTRGT